jgi:ketosteroid isomerase-like protein
VSTLDAPSADDIDALRRLEQRRCDAMESGDAAAFDSLYAPDFVQVHGDGTVDDRAAAVAAYLRLPRQVLSPRQLTIRVMGDVALLTGPMTLGLRQDGEVRRIDIFVGQVARRQGQVWRFSYAQVTLMPSPP